MISPNAYRKIYRASAWYDLAVSAPFALAPVLDLAYPLLSNLAASAGFAALPALQTEAVLFANFFGSVVVIWAIVRLHLDLPILGRYDAVGRLLFSLAMVNALLAGSSAMLIPMLIVEVMFFVLQSLPVNNSRYLELAFEAK